MEGTSAPAAELAVSRGHSQAGLRRVAHGNGCSDIRLPARRATMRCPVSLPSRPLCRMADCRLGAQRPASRRSRGAGRRKPVLAASAINGNGIVSKPRFRMGFRSFVGVPVFRIGCRSRQAASCLAPVRWSWLSSARGTSSTRRSRGERNGGDARAVDSFDGSVQVFENLLPAKVLWIADSGAFHEAAAETVSARSVRRDSRSGGAARAAGDGVPEASRSKRQRSGQCGAPWRVSVPKRALTCRETRGPLAARTVEPTRFTGPASAGRRAKTRVLVFDMWIAQRPSDASRSGPLPKGGSVPA